MTRNALRTTSLRSTPLVLAALALLTTACGNADPLAPRSASAVRTPTSGPARSGYAVSWGRDSSGTGAAAASSGYAVSWGKDGNGNGDGATASSGYAVSWGKDGGDQ